eukprot:m.45282 g.45282  ORF g.45282 m.45282 type:complete len:848 (+) comp11769_c0_seq2:337-2880(+)
MKALRKTHGGPVQSYYDDEATIEQFEPIVEYINKSYKKYLSSTDKLTAKSLASLTFSIMQFQEEFLGSKAESPPITRIPAKLFHDYQPGGGLCVILGAALKFKSERQLRRWDFKSKNKIDSNMELIMSVQKRLVETKKYVKPRVFLHKKFGKNAAQLADMVKRHECLAAASMKEATHIVLPPMHTYDPAEEEWLRPLRREQDKTLVHYWYFPDSYDTWVPSTEVKDEPDPPSPHTGPWVVSARWVQDMDRFNEYMNEEDYEIDSDEVPPDVASAVAKMVRAAQREVEGVAFDDVFADAGAAASDSAKKRAKKPPGSASKQASKRKRNDSPAASPQDDAPRPVKRGHTSRSKEKRKAREDAPPATHDPEPVPRVTKLNVSPAQVESNQELKPLRTAQIADISHLDAGVAKVPHPVRDAGSQTTPMEVVSTSASVLEEQQFHIIVPSAAAWFDYRKIGEIEVRALPEFFNGKNRSKLPEIYMAYRNFMIDTYRLNPTEYLTVTACRRNLAGDVGAIVRVHGFLEQWGLINYQVDQDTRPSPMGPPHTAHFHLIADTPLGYVPVAGLDTPQGMTVEQHVLDVTSSRPKPTSINPNPGLRSDVYKASVNAGNTSTRWTDQEILSLLEAIELHKDDWSRVADYVNNAQHNGESMRTHDDCAMAFLRLPIEDHYLQSEASLGAQEAPFSQAGNPVMATLAFLATAVDPAVAAAGAASGLTSLKKPDQQASEQDTGKEPLDKDQTQTLAKAVLDGATKKAQAMADASERRMQGLAASLIQTQLRKLEIKVKQYEELEKLMQLERRKLADERAKLMQEAQAVRAQQISVMQQAQAAQLAFQPSISTSGIPGGLNG